MNINRVRFGSQNIANRKPSLSNQVPQQRRQMYEKRGKRVAAERVKESRNSTPNSQN